MISDPEGKTESVKSDPGDLACVLELELLQKRAPGYGQTRVTERFAR
jgi:hypothetical protein